MRFSWDPEKDRLNRQKHRLSFETATLAFSDPFALTDQDRLEGGEERWQTIGLIEGVLVILVAHTFSGNYDGEELVRIISARRATKHEAKRYEQEKLRYI